MYRVADVFEKSSLWDFCDTPQIFRAGHIGAQVFCSDVTVRTQRGRAHGRRDDSIDCDADIRGRLRATQMGYEARQLRDRQVEEKTGQTLQLKPVISEHPAWDSHREAESSLDPGRSECSLSTCSSFSACLKLRICFFAINSVSP
jgi:hypothetical protein